MSNITISNLHSVGSELLSDSESFMSELSDIETFSIQGGSSPICVSGAIAFTVGVTGSLIYTYYEEREQEGMAA